MLLLSSSLISLRLPFPMTTTRWLLLAKALNFSSSSGEVSWQSGLAGMALSISTGRGMVSTKPPFSPSECQTLTIETSLRINNISAPKKGFRKTRMYSHVLVHLNFRLYGVPGDISDHVSLGRFRKEFVHCFFKRTEKSPVFAWGRQLTKLNKSSQEPHMMQISLSHPL